MKYCNKCGQKINEGKRTCPTCHNRLIDYEKYANDGLFWAIVSIFLFIFLKGFSFYTSIWGLAKSFIALKSEIYKSKAKTGFYISLMCIILNIILVIISFLER